MAEPQTSEDIDKTAKALRDNDPPPDTRPPVNVNDSLGVNDATMKSVTSSMASNVRDKIAAEDRVFGQIESTQAKIMPKLESMVEHMGVEAGEMKPWNAEAEAAKRHTDPVMAFGSFGSAFGIMASAFTRNPMVNALNASAAAMDALKAGDEKSYERAYKAWQDNTKQALERHKVQHDAYSDASSLLSTNMTAASTKLHVLAARFGDQQMLTLLDHGMNKDAQDLMHARDKNAQDLEINQGKVDKVHLEKQRLYALGYDPKNPQSAESQEAYKKFEQEKAELKRAPQRFNTDEEIINTLRDEHEAAGKAPPTAAEIAEALKKAKSGGAGGNSTLTNERTINKDGDDRKQRQREAHPDWDEDKLNADRDNYVRGRKQASTSITPNQRDKIMSLYDRAGMMSETIDKADSLLAKHRGLTGLGGTVTRPMEAVSNIFGSNETDRAQFRRYISELQEWGTRVLNESSGRPLSAEVGKLAAILPGLSMGDTTANTVRAYRELKPLIATIQEQMKKRMEGTWSPETSPGAGTSKGSPKDQPWLRDKKVAQ